MAETQTQNSPEVVSAATEQLPDPESVRELMSMTTRLLDAVTDVADLLKNEDGLARLIGPEKVDKISESLAVLQRLGKRNAKVRAARRRERRLAELAAELGEPKEKVFDKALAFFKDAIEAERRGEQVVIVNKDYDVLTELSGFMSGAPSSQ